MRNKIRRQIYKKKTKLLPISFSLIGFKVSKKYLKDFIENVFVNSKWVFKNAGLYTECKTFEKNAKKYHKKVGRHGKKPWVS